MYEIPQRFLLWFIAKKEKHTFLHEVSRINDENDDPDDISKEILPILSEQAKAGSASAEETYRKIQYQLKLHQKIENEIFNNEERFLYYSGVKKFFDLEKEFGSKIETEEEMSPVSQLSTNTSIEKSIEKEPLNDKPKHNTSEYFMKGDVMWYIAIRRGVFFTS